VATVTLEQPFDQWPPTAADFEDTLIGLEVKKLDSPSSFAAGYARLDFTPMSGMESVQF
jgi:hypothetical protein